MVYSQIGKFHEFQLGMWFRQRYEHLLPDHPYRYDRILVNSSDVDRTIMSAELFLAGLDPPDATEMWNDKIYWQPVPVHTLPKPLDNVEDVLSIRSSFGICVYLSSTVSKIADDFSERTL